MFTVLLSAVFQMLLRHSHHVRLLGHGSDPDVYYGADTDSRNAVAWRRQFQGDLSQLFRRENYLHQLEIYTHIDTR